MLRKLLSPVRQLASQSLRSMGWEFFRKEHIPYGFSECHDIARFLGGPAQVRTVFDVGANAGQFALRFAQYYLDAEIYSFEPIPSTFEELTRNTSSRPRIHCIPMALGSRQEISTVVLQSNSAINSLASIVNEKRRLESGGPEISVTVDTVDHFCDNHGISHIDILKSDTEGFDLEVLKGAAGMLARGRVKFLLVECDFDDWGLTPFSELYAYCREFNLHFLGLYESHFSPPPEPPRLWYTNALFSV